MSTGFKVGFLIKKAEVVPETLVYSPLNYLTRLLAREYFIEHPSSFF